MNPSTKALSWAALAALTIASTTAQAGLFNFNNTGSFGSSTTLGGVALGADTPYSLTATFDDASVGFSGFDQFPVTALSLNLTGHGTYTAIPDSNLTVYLSSSGGYRAGLINSTAGFGYVGSFSSSSNVSFSSSTPSPTIFSNFQGLSDSFPYGISLVGVSGGLSIQSFGATPMTASITAVPEPAEYAAVTGLALGVFALVQRRRQAAGR